MPRVDKDTFIQEMLAAHACQASKPEPDSKDWWREVAQGLGVKCGDAERRAEQAEKERLALVERLERVEGALRRLRDRANEAQRHSVLPALTADYVIRTVDAALAAGQPVPSDPDTRLPNHAPGCPRFRNPKAITRCTCGATARHFATPDPEAK